MIFFHAKQQWIAPMVELLHGTSVSEAQLGNKWKILKREKEEIGQKLLVAEYFFSVSANSTFCTCS